MEIVVSVRKITLRTILEVLAHMVAHTAALFLHTILVNLALMVPMVALLRTIPVALAHMVAHTAALFLHTILVALAHTVVLMADLFHRTILVALAHTVDLARFLEPLPELMKRPKP